MCCSCAVIISFSGFFCGGLNVSADSSRMCSQVTHVKWPIKGAIEDGRAVSSAALSRDTNQTRALSLKCKLDSFISHLPALSLFITHMHRETRLPGDTAQSKRQFCCWPVWQDIIKMIVTDTGKHWFWSMHSGFSKNSKNIFYYLKIPQKWSFWTKS